ncbi:T9SS type A sorting domain-containing protein, partial [bacterium]|nr:T9SS type A sorting domain-containing protein [bacterium]
TTATMYGDIIEWNSTGETDDAGIGFLNTSPFLQGVWVRNNMDIGMECLGSSAVDMDPEMENAFKNNGWTEVDGDPLLDRIADVDEIWLYKNADVMIDEGNNDIYDDLGVDDHLMTRNDNLFQIDGTENYWKGALDDAFTPENPVLVTRADEGAGPYTTAGFDCDEEAYNLFIRALDNMKDEDFEDALDILCEIVTEFPDSRAAANTPMQILRCVRELDLDRERFRDFLLDIEVNNEILNSNRHLVANLFLLDLGEYEPAIENFTDVRDDAENQQDRIIAEMNLAYAEFIRSAREDHDGINSAGMSFDAKLKKLLNRLHSDSLSLVSSPLTFELCTVYPNPFNSTTTIRYKLTSAADISVNVFDMAGRQIAILHQGYIEAGEHTVSWIADDVPSGVYMVRLEAEGKVDVRKVVLMR